MDEEQRQLLIQAIELAHQIIESDNDRPLIDGLRDTLEQFIREAESKLDNDQANRIEKI